MLSPKIFENLGDIPSKVHIDIAKNELNPMRAWREYMGLQKRELAEAMGISTSTYSRLENYSDLPISVIKDFSKAIGVNPKLVYYYYTDPTNKPPSDK